MFYLIIVPILLMIIILTVILVYIYFTQPEPNIHNDIFIIPTITSLPDDELEFDF
jgi:hypothetical protein